MTDPSGALVKNAEVTIIGTDTGATVRVLKTNDRGIAEVPLLQPGRYDTHVLSFGFKSIDRTGVTVSVGDVVSLAIPLTLGESADTVTVSGEAPLIDDKLETISQVISGKELTDLPLNGRNYLMAANYVPGWYRPLPDGKFLFCVWEHGAAECVSTKRVAKRELPARPG